MGALSSRLVKHKNCGDLWLRVADAPWVPLLCQGPRGVDGALPMDRILEETASAETPDWTLLLPPIFRHFLGGGGTKLSPFFKISIYYKSVR